MCIIYLDLGLHEWMATDFSNFIEYHHAHQKEKYKFWNHFERMIWYEGPTNTVTHDESSSINSFL